MVKVLFPDLRYVNLGDEEQVAKHLETLEEGEGKALFLEKAEMARKEIKDREWRKKNCNRKLWTHERHDFSNDSCVP